MGIADFFRPKHRHSNSSVRAEAVKALTSDDGDILLQVASTDRDPDVRRLAVSRINRADVLAKLFTDESDDKVRSLIGERAASLWVATAVNPDGDDVNEALMGLVSLGDQKALAEVAARGSASVRKRALAELRDPRALAELARIATQPEVRRDAIARIDDAEVLRALATDSSHKDVGLAAIEKLDDPEMLEVVAQKAKHKAVRLRARKVLTEMAAAEKARTATKEAASPKVPDAVRRRQAEKAQLLREVEAVALDFDAGPDVVRATESKFAALKAGDDIDAKFDTFVTKYWRRHESYARQTAATARAVAPVVERAPEPAQSVAPEDTMTEAERTAHEAARDAHKAVELAKRAEADAARAAVDAERAARADERTKRVEQVSAHLAVVMTDLEKMAQPDVVGTLDLRTVDGVLSAAVGDLDALSRMNVPGVADMIEKFEAMRIPLLARAVELREAEEWQRYANVPRAEQLVRAAEELATTEVDDVGGVLKMLQGMWREMGPLPPKKSKELWEKFKAFGDQAYEKVKSQRAENAEKYAEIAAAKERLIAAAEELSESTDWSATAAQLKTLQGEWKLSGALPRKQADALWNRFRTACDKFFQRRAPELEAQFAEQQANLTRKTNIVERMEALVAAAKAGAPEGGWGRAISEMKSLQRDWKEVGFVPRRDADASYERFRAAGDALFAYLDESKGAEADGRRQALDSVRSELTRLLGLNADSDGAAAVTAALAARDSVRDMIADGGVAADVSAQLGRALHHVGSTFAEAARGTELDLAAAEGRLRKLIARATELAPTAADAPAAPAATAEALAERLKLAMAQNAFGGLRFSGRDPVEVIAELRAEWSDAAALAPTVAAGMRGAFDDACAAAGAEDVDAASTAPAVVAPVAAVAAAAISAAPAAGRGRSITTPPPLDELDTAWDLDDEVAAAAPARLAPKAAADEEISTPSSSEMAGDGAAGGDELDSGWD